MLVFITQVYHNARSTECEISNSCVVLYIYVYIHTEILSIWQMSDLCNVGMYICLHVHFSRIQLQAFEGTKCTIFTGTQKQFNVWASIFDAEVKITSLFWLVSNTYFLKSLYYRYIILMNSLIIIYHHCYHYSLQFNYNLRTFWEWNREKFMFSLAKISVL
jgi:hypothetical protein